MRARQPSCNGAARRKRQSQHGKRRRSRLGHRVVVAVDADQAVVLAARGDRVAAAVVLEAHQPHAANDIT